MTRFTLIFIISIFLAGCLGIMEKTGQVLDGSAREVKIISHYKAFKDDGSVLNIEMFTAKNKNNEQFIIFTFTDFPMIKIRASYPEQGVLSAASLEYLAGNIHGWNEYSLDLLGESAFSFEDDAILDSLEIEKIQISKGRIHRYDTRITGNEALTALRNRRERISTVVEWMKLMEGAPEKQSMKEFEKFWKPILFPETVKKKEKPSGWKQKDDVFEKADDIRWNKGYTQRVFKEELWLVRDSGTMLRDWEEALSWIYMEYNWNVIMEIFTNKIKFTKIK